MQFVHGLADALMKKGLRPLPGAGQVLVVGLADALMKKGLRRKDETVLLNDRRVWPMP